MGEVGGQKGRKQETKADGEGSGKTRTQARHIDVPKGTLRGRGLRSQRHVGAKTTTVYVGVCVPASPPSTQAILFQGLGFCLKIFESVLLQDTDL